jgi:hypothetical protein
LHEVFKTFGGPHSSGIWKLGMSALVNFKFHMIARIVDTTQVIMDHIRVHDHFENAWKTRLNWSKIVQDESHAPWQIVKYDPHFLCNQLSGVVAQIQLEIECNRNVLTSCLYIL